MLRWQRWWVALVAIAWLCTVTLSNCTRPARLDQPPAQSRSIPPGVLVYGAGGQPVNLESGNVVDGNSIIVQDQIYNRLVDFKPGTTEPEPSLATAWSADVESKVWTFQLRRGVKFHDGTDFNAAAVQFNIERWWDPNHPYGYRNAGKTYSIWQDYFGGYKGDSNSLLQAFVVVDPFTVQFRLKRPFAAFPVAIGSGYFGIASPQAIQQAGAKYGTPNSKVVGTGPFVFQEWRTGDRIVLNKNPNYWQADLPKVDQVVVQFIADPSARLAQLRAGQIDFTVDLVPDQLPEIQADSNLESVPRPSFNVGYLGLNPSYKPLADRRVRQAIAQAINRTEIVQAFWGNLGLSDPHFSPPALAEFQSPTLTNYEFNLQQAKQALAQAGYPNGFDLELWYMPVSRPYFPTPKPIAEAFAADLSNLGIRVSLKTKDWAAYLADRKKPPGFQAFMMGWTGDYGDPDNFYYPHFGPGSTSDLGNWQNSRVLELLDQGRATGDRRIRTKIYAEVDEILHQEVVRLPIVHSQPLLAKRKAITGWVPSPVGSESFAAIAKPI